MLARMPVYERLARRVQRGEPLPYPIDLALRPAAAAIQWGMRRRLRRPAERTTAYVVSFGNLSAGGTGKTPAVIERASQERSEGRRVAVLTRGYGAPSPEPAVSVDLQRGQYYERLGDEAALILERVPDVVVVKNPDRVQAARCAMEDHGCRVLILDDGFQYTALARDENILVVDATNPFGSGRLLPRGALREPMSAISRADQVVLSRCDQAGDVEAVLSAIREVAPELPVRKTFHAPAHIRHIASGIVEPLEWLRNRPVIAACGIGHPEAFFETLRRLGATLQETRAFRDHRPFDDLPRVGTIVTTEKDAVRFGSAPENLYALAIDLAEWPPT